MKYLNNFSNNFTKVLIKIFIISLCFINVSMAEQLKAWKIDNNYLTSKCFVDEEIFGNISDEEIFTNYSESGISRFVLKNPQVKIWRMLDTKSKVNTYFFKNIGVFYNNGISLDINLKSNFGTKNLSFSKNLKDCSSPKKSNKSQFISYNVLDSEYLKSYTCKLMSPFIKNKCIDLKIIKLNKISKDNKSSTEYINVYGIYELEDNKKIILPLAFNYYFKEKNLYKKNWTSNFDWLKNNKNIMMSGLLLYEDEFHQLLKNNISLKNNFYLMGTGDKFKKKKSLYLNLIDIFSGQSNVVDYRNSRNYFLASADRMEGNSSGFIFVDFNKKNVIGLIYHNFYQLKRSYNDSGSILIFSKNYKNIKDLPDQFLKSSFLYLNNKLMGKENLLLDIDKIYASKEVELRFVGSDGKIVELGDYYSNNNQKIFSKEIKWKDLYSPIDSKLLEDISGHYLRGKQLGFGLSYEAWLNADIKHIEKILYSKLRPNSLFKKFKKKYMKDYEDMILRFSAKSLKMKKIINELVAEKLKLS